MLKICHVEFINVGGVCVCRSGLTHGRPLLNKDALEVEFATYLS